jgi:hypothetical protein
MTDALSKYPLAQKAAEDNVNYVEGVFFMLGGEAACDYAPRRIAEIVDQTIDEVPVMKEALMIGTFYTMNTDMMQEGVPDDFEDVYTPEARMIVDEMFIMANLEGAVPSDRVLKVQAIFAIASIETLVDVLKEVEKSKAASGEKAEAKKEMSQEMIAGMKAEIEEDEKRLLPGLEDAPKLKALYLKAKADIFALVEKPAADPGSKPAAPEGPAAA